MQHLYFKEELRYAPEKSWLQTNNSKVQTYEIPIRAPRNPADRDNCIFDSSSLKEKLTHHNIHIIINAVVLKRPKQRKYLEKTSIKTCMQVIRDNY